MRIYSFILLVYAFGASGAEDPEAGCVLAKTESGLVCGAKNVGVDGQPFASFLGVRYAKPPLGELRFAELQRPEPYSGIFNATVQGPICPQNYSNIVGLFMRPTSMSEDCIHLNIHVPLTSLPDSPSEEEGPSEEGPSEEGPSEEGPSEEGPSEEGPSEELQPEKPLLPILVFIHGGSYTSGAGDPDTHGPDYLMPKGIMLITLNTRIGAFGFLSLRSGQIPGNNGLRDIITALQWIKRNIRNFGGDPDRVTVGGISSGAGLAHLLSTSPAVRGKNLFQRIILMSNTALSNIVMSAKTAKSRARIFLKGMGISHLKDPEEIHRELTQAPLGKILEAQLYVAKIVKVRTYFAPVVDKARKGYPVIVLKEPEKMLDEGYGKEYAALFSFTSSECSVYPTGYVSILKVLKRFPAALIPSNLLATANIFTIPILRKMLMKQYFNGSVEDLNQLIPYCTDSRWKYPVLRTIDKRLANGAEDSFFYEFSYEWQGTRNPIKEALNSNWTGVGHSEDLVYIFRMKAAEEYVKEHGEVDGNSNLKIRDFMTDTFANFVKFGHPGATLADWTPSTKMYEHMSVVAPEPIFHPASPEMLKMKKFFDKFYRVGLGQIFPPMPKNGRRLLVGRKGSIASNI